MNYRPDIDGLRALAVLSVVFCHVGLGFPGGYVGVDVFFVISGYLITCLMLKDVEAGTFSLAHFWERRIRRILPALVFVVAASFVAGWFISSPTAYNAFGRSVCELVIMKANVHFSHDLGYFAASAETKPLLHTWSLAVEEQFYLSIPLLFWFAVRFLRRRWLLPVLILLTAVSFGLSVYGVAGRNPKTYFALTARAWELLAGVILAVIVHDRSLVRRTIGVWRRELLATAALMGIVVPLFFYHDKTPFPGLAALPPVLGTVMLIAMGAEAERKTLVHRLLSNPAAVYVGLISYSLYLWHWPLIVYFKSVHVAPLSMLERAAIVSASIGLADITRRLVETPFRTRKLLSGRVPVFATTAVVVIALHTSGKIVRSTAGFADRMPQEVRNFVATGEFYRADPAHWAPGVKVPESLLRIGSVEVEPSLLIWGDSHGQSIIPAAERVCLANGIAARAALQGGWSPVAEHQSEESPETFAAARAHGDEVKQYIRTAGVRIVILAAHWRRYSKHPQFAEAIIRAVDELRGMDCDVYFMKDIPEYEYDVVGMLTQRAWHGQDTSGVGMTLEEYDSRNQFYRTLLPQLTEHGAKVLDPLPGWQAVTKSTKLPACDAGGMYYYDSHHLSVYGSKLIDPMLKPIAARSAIHTTADSGPATTAGSANVVR
jgi:peptidoglycan/LPS O-acetylase OafA/YrhL